MKKKKYRTDFLFPNTGFWEGMGSVVSVVGNYYEFNHSETEREADANAIESDWMVVGQDINQVIVTEDVIKKLRERLEHKLHEIKTSDSTNILLVHGKERL